MLISKESFTFGSRQEPRDPTRCYVSARGSLGVRAITFRTAPLAESDRSDRACSDFECAVDQVPPNTAVDSISGRLYVPRDRPEHLLDSLR